MNKLMVYSDMLENLFNKYSGVHENLLRKIPIFFKILQEIYAFEDLDWESKFKINSCFSYFAVPTDIIPDNLGPEGYLDDLFVCTYVLRSFIPKNSNLIEKYSNSKTINSKIIEETYQELIKILGNKSTEILNFIGLSKFDELAQNLTFLEVPKNSKEKLRRIQLENLELMALLQTIIKKFQHKGNKIQEYDKMSKLRRLFEDKEWEKVEKIIGEIKIYEEIFDDEDILKRDKFCKKTQEDLNEIRLKASLEIDKIMLEDYDE